MLFFEMAVMSDMNVRPPKEGRDSSEELTQDPPSQNEDGAPGKRTQEHRRECPCHGGGGKWRRFGLQTRRVRLPKLQRRRVTRHQLRSFPHHWQLLPYESYALQYLPLHQVSMSARRHFWSAAACRRFY